MAQADRDPLIRGALVASAAFNLGAALMFGFPSSLGRLAGLPVARECLNEGAVVGEAGADAVAIFDHGCARTVIGQRPCHLVATHMASAVAARLATIPQGPVAKARHIQRAAASPLSSGRVLKAMAA